MKKTLKKLMGILALSTILCTTPVFASEPLNLNIFGKSVVGTDAAPYLEESRTMVPMRLISENLGFDVKWDGNTKAFSVEGVEVVDKESVLIVGKMNQSEVLVTKKGITTNKSIDNSSKVVVTMKNNRLYVPLRFFSESFGLVVKYDAANRTVFIYYPGDKDPAVSADVVWTGNAKDFVTAVSKIPNMVLTTNGEQSALNKTDLLVTDSKYSPNGKGSKVEITVSNWTVPGRFYPDAIKNKNQKIMDTTKTVLEMFTADKTVYDKINKTIINEQDTTINTSDGKKITISGEASGIKIRFY